ncbi:MAG: hypothetical protein JRI75_05640 [Deltaproteobacteria bacterium]|nr:hypothetical protein [Deltaproteobacteria bacterium]
MVNIPKNLEKELGVRTLPKPAKKSRKWNLLIVGDDGRILPVTRFKGLMVISAVVLIAAIIAAASFYFINKKTIKKSSKLAGALEKSRQRANTLQDEKERLMTRLVLAESRIKEIQAKHVRKPASENPPAASAPVETKPDVSGPEKISVDPKPKQEKEPATVAQAAAAEDAYQEGVSVEAVTLLHETETRRLKVQFQLKNTDPAGEVISGYAFVILRDETAGKAGWLIFPSVKLISGKPSPINRGQYFSISRFKSMKFEKENMTASERYKSAEIIVFDTAGKLLMKKTVPVSSIEAKDSVPAA